MTRVRDAAAPKPPCARRVIVFARVPRLGEVKTRLAAVIGDARALAAHRALLERTLAVAARVPGCELELCVDGADADGECAALAARFGAATARQRGADLGERMDAALRRALRERRLPVLVGCDCPVLDDADLAAAFDALGRHDAVFAPAEDGGYVLVGVRRPLDGLFDGPRWGSDAVMRTTRERLSAIGATWLELRTLWDVDDADGWTRWSGGA